MSEKKNDLTGLLDYSKELQEMGVELHPSAQGDGAAVMSDTVIEKVDDFESLDDYAKTNPLAVEQIPVEASTSIPEAVEENPAAPVIEPPTGEFSVTLQPEMPIEPPPEASTEMPPETPIENSTDFSTSAVDFPETPPENTFETSPESTVDFPVAEVQPPPPASEESSDFSHSTSEEISPPLPEVNLTADVQSFSVAQPLPPPAPEPKIQVPPTMPAAPRVDPLTNARILSESITPGQPAVAAQYPFSLRIDGFLNNYEKEKLSDLLAKENFGFRELDLEPQFEAGKILLPRISEYAGVLVIQALRGANVQFRFGPTDEGFSSSESDSLTLAPASSSQSQAFHLEELGLPLVTHPLQENARFQVIETVSVSSILETRDVEVENSTAYLDAVQALKSELQYKAHRKSATAVFGFTLELTTLPTSYPPQYRLTATGVAVKTV